MPISYAELGETLEGIDMSLAGDEMLFRGAKPKSARQFVRDLVKQVRENECAKRGISMDEQFNLPPDTMLDESSEKIWADGCVALDKAIREFAE